LIRVMTLCCSCSEVELLEMPNTGWNISVTQWPSILLSNEVSASLSYYFLGRIVTNHNVRFRDSALA
jgi:hypothetical protein